MSRATSRYPAASLAADYGQGVVGLLLTGAPLLLLPLSGWVAVPLGVGGALFGAFLLRTALRQATTLHVDAHGLTVEGPLSRLPDLGPRIGPGRRRLAWTDLRTLKLH